MTSSVEGNSGNFSRNMDFSSPDFNIEDVRRELAERGVAVIERVIPSDVCDSYVAQIQEWLDQFDGFFPSNIHSIIHKYSVSHMEPAWAVRLRAKPLFSALWGTDKLLTSTDGIAVGKPPEEGGADFGSREKIEGLHLDQGPRRPGLHAYQGAVYLEEASEDDWCFTVIEQSHKHHSEFFQHFKPGRSEFKPLSNREKQFYLNHDGCSVRRIAVPKGGIVLWDSRTVHAGAPPIFMRRNMDRWRYVIFVSQTPAIWATPEDLALKKEAYEQLRCSSHWSSIGLRNFKTGTTEYDIKELPQVAQTHEAQQLAGVRPYDFGDGKPHGPRFTMSSGATF